MKPTDMRAKVALLAACGVLAAAGRARATDTTGDETPPTPAASDFVPLARPWAVTAEMSFHIFAPQPEYAALGVSVERTLSPHLALDASVARPLESSEATTGGLLDVQPGLDLAARARGVLPIDRRGVNALFASLGPQLSMGGLYGDLWRAQAELGYELRAAGGFSLLYAAGVEWDLVSHAAPLDPASCVSPVCAPAHKPGAQTSTIRFGLGYAF